MTIKKTFVGYFEHRDGSIEHFTVKARIPDEAIKIAQERYKDYWVSVCSLREHNSYLRGRSDETRSRDPIVGRYIFQHKGRKRRGCKNYPTPKGGWSRYRIPSLIYTEQHGTEVSQTLDKWIREISEPATEQGVTA